MQNKLYSSNSLFTIAFLCLVFTLTLGEEDNPKRSNPLLRRAGARAGPLNKSTTTTAAPKQEEEELGDEEYDQSEDLDEAEKEQDETAVSPTTTTSTEPPKKIGPIIRPFRSNDDLLLALKRRQMNVKKGVNKVEKPAAKLESESSEKEDSAAPAPIAKASNDRSVRRKFGGSRPAGESDETSGPADEQPIKKPSRFNLRSSRSN